MPSMKHGLVAGVAFLVACSVAERRPAAESDTRAAVQAAMDRYIGFLKAVSSDSVASMFTADGEMLQPGMASLRGREAIRGFLAPFDGRTQVDTARTVTEALELHGPTAYLWGSYHQVAHEAGSPPGSFNGRFVAKWQLEPNGEWRIARLFMQPGPNPSH